jgi:hypothetical protein
MYLRFRGLEVGVNVVRELVDVVGVASGRAMYLQCRHIAGGDPWNP